MCASLSLAVILPALNIHSVRVAKVIQDELDAKAEIDAASSVAATDPQQDGEIRRSLPNPTERPNFGSQFSGADRFDSTASQPRPGDWNGSSVGTNNSNRNVASSNLQPPSFQGNGFAANGQSDPFASGDARGSLMPPPTNGPNSSYPNSDPPLLNAQQTGQNRLLDQSPSSMDTQMFSSMNSQVDSQADLLSPSQLVSSPSTTNALDRLVQSDWSNATPSKLWRLLFYANGRVSVYGVLLVTGFAGSMLWLVGGVVSSQRQAFQTSRRTRTRRRRR